MRLRLREELRRIIKNIGLTALFVTHDQSEAIALADRVAVMRDGKLLQFSSPAELYNRPADTFVAEFTGAGNLLPAQLLVVDGAKGAALIAGRRVPVTLARPVPAGSTITLVVRPENLRLRAAGADASNRPAWQGHVATRRYQGSQTSYHVDVGGLVLEVVEAGSVPRFAEGENVEVAFPQEALWALPAAGSRQTADIVPSPRELPASDAA